MRLWISTRIPLTPIRVGTSIGGRRKPSGASAGKGIAVLLGVGLLYWGLAEAYSALRAVSLTGAGMQLLVGTGLAVVLLGVAWLLIRVLLGGPPPPPPPSQASVSDRR